MAPVWEAVRHRLEARGTDNRGRVALPALDTEARLALGALLGRAPSSQVNLTALEVALRDLGVGADLAAALAVLGHPVSPDPAVRRAESAAGRAARAAARDEAARWPEGWAPEWIDAVVRAGVLRGLSVEAAVALVRDARRVLDAVVAGAPGVARVELSARVLGDSHALDVGCRLEVAVGRALATRMPGAADPWEAAGVHPDLTSGPVLTWNLPVAPGSGLHAVVAAATAAGVPVHLTRFALADHPVSVTDGATILVVENPRIVEAAVQRRSGRSLVSANGSPSLAVQMLVRQLVDGGADVRYHGDFDSAGLVLCARMADAGVVPWRMTAADYRSALVAAEAEGVALPVDPSPAPPTPWDPALAEAFAADRRVVHEERLLPALLEDRRLEGFRPDGA